MGNWRNRPRFYRRRSPPRSWYYERHSSSSGYGDDDGVPAWEKKFCELIGSVPWQKVVEANYFKSWYQGNVTSWNDSACEETFHNAKKRFWSQINGLPCHISLPDPDMYIDEITWDSVIDPELINDLEQAYFPAPDEEKIDLKLGHGGKNVRNSKMLFEQCNKEIDVVKNPWGCSGRVHGLDTVRNKLKGQNLSESAADNEFKDSNNDLNPWEAKPNCENETAKDATWGVCSGDRWETEGWGNSRWKNKDRGDNSWEKEHGDNDGREKSGHQNKRTRNSNECNAESEMFKNPWESKPSCRTEARRNATWGACSGKVCRGRGWEDNGWGSNGWKNKDWGSKSKENEGRGNKGWDKYVQNPPGSKGQDSSKPNRGYNPWRDDFMPATAALKDCRENAGGWQTHRTSNMKQRKWEVKRSGEERGDLNAVLSKKDDSHGYHSNYRNSRFNRDDNQSSGDWRNVKVNRTCHP